MVGKDTDEGKGTDRKTQIGERTRIEKTQVEQDTGSERHKGRRYRWRKIQVRDKYDGGMIRKEKMGARSTLLPQNLFFAFWKLGVGPPFAQLSLHLRVL